MGFGRKIVVAVDMQNTKSEHLRELRSMEFLEAAEVHFVHVYQTTISTYGLGEFCQVYPVGPDRECIEGSITGTMKLLCEGSVGPETKTIYRCLFDENPKEELCLYAREVKADTIIVFTRKRHGFFESSFAQYVVRHSPCHTLILKPAI